MKMAAANNTAPVGGPGGEIDLNRFALLGALNLKPDELQGQLEQARTPQAMQQLRRRIVSVARAFSQNYKIKVLPCQEKRWALAIDKDAEAAAARLGEGSRTTLLDVDAKKFKPRAIMYNMDDLALAPEKQVFRRLRHEATRACECDLRYLFEGFNRAERSEKAGAAFGLLYTTCEEARVYQREAGASKAAMEALRAAMEDRLAEIRSRINQQPLLEQLCVNLLYGIALHGEPLPEIKDQRVIDATVKIRPAFEQYLFSNNHAANLDNVERNLWPEAKALESASVNDEMTRLVARDLQRLGQAEHTFNKRFWKRAVNGLRYLVFMKPKRFTPKEEDKGVFAASDSHGGPMLRTAIRKFLDVQQADAELFRAHAERSSETLGLRQSVDLAGLNNMLPALQAVVDSLEPNDRAGLEARAKQAIMASHEDLLRRQLPIGIDLTSDDKKQSRLNVNSVPSVADVKQQEDEIQELARDFPQETRRPPPNQDPDSQARAATLEHELRRRKLVSQGFTEQEEELYENFKALERSLIRRLSPFLDELRPILPKRRGWDFGRDLHYTGSRLDKRAVVRQAPIKDSRVWQRRMTVESPDPCMFVTLLIDNSPSMADRDKIVEARKTAIFWARALKDLGIPFAIKYFGGETFDLKSFAQDYDDPAARVKPALISRLDASTGSTDIGTPLQRAEADMTAEQRRLRGFFGAIFVISDGGANQGLQGQALRDYIRALKKKYLVMNFMLASDGAELANAQAYFGVKNVVAPASFDRLPAESIRVLRNVLREGSQRIGGVRSAYAGNN